MMKAAVKNRITRIAAMLMACLLCLGLWTASASASEPEPERGVTYSTEAEAFAFTPGTGEYPTDLFSDLFKDMMPGDTATDSVFVKNDADSGCAVNIYMRSLGGDEELEDFLSKLTLTVTAADGEVFNGNAYETDGLTGWVLLGTLAPGAETVLTLSLSVPAELGNVYADLTGRVTWEFMAEEIEDEFFPMDEEIVPDGDGEANPSSWVTKESVNEYDAIQIEMSTTIPAVNGVMLAQEDYSLTFHNQLVTQLVLDKVESDFTVDINGTPIDGKYYEIDMAQQASPLSALQALSISDGCTFHVNLDLTALYNDGVITDDDLGTASVRVFFFADLEATDVNGSYTSTAWYDVAAGGEVIYTSEQSVVSVYTFEALIDKYDTETEEPLADAVFGIYYDEAFEDAVTRSGADYVVTTGSDGQAMFVGIAEGTYYLKELEAPEGYEPVDGAIAVTLEGSENGEHIIETAVGNTPLPEAQPGPDEPRNPEKTANVEAGASVEVGDEITYTISYYNNNDINAIITITDALAGGADYVSSNPEGEYDSDTHTVVWTFEADAFEEGSVELNVKVNGNAAGSELDNTAGVQIGNEAIVDTNTVGIQVGPKETTGPDTPRSPEKSANVQAGAKVAVGDEITYTITYYNHNDVSSEVVIADALDAGLDFVSATDGGIYDDEAHSVAWVISEAPAHTEGSVAVTIKVNDEALEKGTVSNTASVKIGSDDAAYTNTVGTTVTDKGTGNGGNGGNGGTGTGKVKTSDTGSTVFYLVLMLAAGAVVAALCVRRRTVRM